ncbi:TPA: lipopolysaccharide biosynthesis protein [Photobacterium damselae]
MNTDKIGYFFLDVFNKALPFLIIPFITSNVSLDEYGKIDIFVSSYIFIGFILGFGFEGWISANYFKRDRIELYRVIKTYLLIDSFIAFIIFIILFFCKGLYSVVVLVAFVNSCLMVLTTILRMDNKFTVAGLFLFLNSLLNVLLLLILFLIFKPSYESRVYSLLISSLFMLGFIFLYTFKFYHRIFKLKVINYKACYPVLVFCLPLCLSMLSSWVKGNIDKFYITSMLSSSDLALYSLAFQLSSIINVLVITLNKIYQPTFFKQKNEGISQVKNIIFFVVFIVVITIVYYFSLSFVFEYIFDTRYVLTLKLIPYLLFSYFLLTVVMVLNNELLYMNNSKLIMIQVMISSTIHILLSYFFLSRNGLFGSVFAQIVSSFISFSITVGYLFISYKKGRGDA